MHRPLAFDFMNVNLKQSLVNSLESRAALVKTDRQNLLSSLGSLGLLRWLTCFVHLAKGSQWQLGMLGHDSTDSTRLPRLTLHKEGRIMIVERNVEEFDGQESDTGSG